jgi:hypothetical protein
LTAPNAVDDRQPPANHAFKYIDPEWHSAANSTGTTEWRKIYIVKSDAKGELSAIAARVHICPLNPDFPLDMQCFAYYQMPKDCRH